MVATLLAVAPPCPRASTGRRGRATALARDARCAPTPHARLRRGTGTSTTSAHAAAGLDPVSTAEDEANKKRWQESGGGEVCVCVWVGGAVAFLSFSLMRGARRWENNARAL